MYQVEASRALLLPVYGALLLPSLGYVPLVLSLLVLGAYFAAKDGVTTALAGAILPERLQSNGIGIPITVVSACQLASSLLFGALWLTIGLGGAVAVFVAALIAAPLVAAPLFVRSQREPVHD